MLNRKSERAPIGKLGLGGFGLTALSSFLVWVTMRDLGASLVAKGLQNHCGDATRLALPWRRALGLKLRPDQGQATVMQVGGDVSVFGYQLQSENIDSLVARSRNRDCVWYLRELKGYLAVIIT